MKYFYRRIKSIFFLCIILLVAYQCWVFGWLVWWKYQPPQSTHFMTQRLAEMQKINPRASLQYEWVAYEKISPNLKRAVVAAEDDKFLAHQGFDWEAMASALQRNQRKGRPVAGASTISQQLAKNLFLSPSRNYFRKAEEALITIMLEALWDKRRILEVYLNVVEWGSGTFGAQAGARRHFAQSAANLSEYQAVRMAVMLPNPRRYERNPPAFVINHANSLLARMRFSAIP